MDEAQIQSTPQQGYVSIIGTSYLHPIATLIEGLDLHNTRGPNEVQSSTFENGYSTSIIVLAVMLLESAISRTQYILGVKPPKKPIEFVIDAYPDNGYSDKLEELFVIRDVIAHNHIWEASIYWDETLEMRLIDAEMKDGYGDKKFRRVLNPSTRTSRLLKLNLFPTRIHRGDCITVLKNTVEFLLFLEHIDRKYIYLSPQYVKYKGNLVPFVEIIEKL